MVVFRTAAIAVLVGVLVFAWMSVFTVDERKKALVVRFGQVNRIIEKPGLYFKLPIADEVVTIEDRTFMWNSDDKAVQVSDKQRYLVDTVTLARIMSAQKFRETVGADVELARQRIETRLDAALRQTYGKRTFEAALSKDRDVMMREIRDQVRGEAQALGLEIVDVRIRRTDLMAEVLEATYERMKSERLAEAKDLRGKGEALNIQMKAQADRKALELVSDANRQSEIIRGDGDAERARVFAEAYQKDPEFYSFYRSMQAYAKSLAGKGTTLVLSPDSEFFKYFGVIAPRTKEPAPVQ
ncbi:MAG TPA: protease modulator HflC [Aestuariivirga sp.]|nr:protease modulator HflC [Aestuariivirga sp.]